MTPASTGRLVRQLLAGEDALLSIAWSPDGTRIAIGGDLGPRVVTPEGTVIWHANNPIDAWSIAWSPDGLRIATGSTDGTMQVWDAHAGSELHRWRAHTESVYGLVFTPKGDLISASWDGTARVWDPATAAALFNCTPPGVRKLVGAALSPDGSTLALGGNEVIHLLDLRTGEQLRSCRGHTSQVYWLAFSHDGSTLASTSSDWSVRLWETRTGVEISCYEGHKAASYGVAISPDGAFVFSSSFDATIRVWNARTGGAVAVLGRHAERISAVALSPDGARLASASDDRTAALWDLSEWVKPALQQPQPDVLDWVGRQVETVGRRPLFAPTTPWVPRLESDGTDDCIGMVRADGRMAARVAIDGGTQTLLVGQMEGTVRNWDLRTGALRWETREHHENNIWCIALSPDGRILATGSQDSVRLWDARSGAPLWGVEARGRPIWSVAWSPDARWLAIGYSEGHVEIRDPRSGMQLFRSEETCDALGLAFAPNGQSLATSGTDGIVRVWSTPAGKEVLRWVGHEGSVESVAFSPDGRNIASGGADKTIRIWDARTGDALLTCVGHESSVHDVAFSPDGNVLASCANDYSVRVWSVDSGQQLHRFSQPRIIISSIAFSQDGAFLASTHLDEVTRLWDTRRFLRRASPRLLEDATEPLSPALAQLPSAWAGLERAGLHLPLSLVLDLLAVTAGQNATESLSSLAEHPGVRRLAKLGWPTSARVGLVALLAREIRDERWAPPSLHSIAGLRQLLERALGGASVDARPPPAPITLLTEAANQIDDGTMTLLHALGRDAVAADPSLVLTLRSHAQALPALTESQRRILERPLLGLDAGQAQGAGTGADRGGIGPRGPLSALLSSQLVYPSELLALKHHDGGLLYRARMGRQRPELRPTVLLLDVSPGCFGPVESITRPAAFLIAQALRRRALPVRLLAVGGQTKVRALERPQDLIDMLIVRSFEPVEMTAALRMAERAAGELAAETGSSPLVVLLTQPYWGAEVVTSARTPGLRALFVQYPGQRVRPSFAAQCERWESIGANESERLSEVLGRLVA